MFEVGQQVLCINDQAMTGGQVPGLVDGGVYTVEAAFNGYGNDFVVLVGIATNMESRGYLASRFRPLDDPFIEHFRDMARECDVPVRAWEGP